MARTTQNKLDYLKETKGLIREAIEAKGQTVADSDTFRSYAEKINAIKTDPVLEELEVTKNGTYTAPDGVDGYNKVNVNVDSTKITILEEQEMTGFALDEDFGYCKIEFPPPFTMAMGEKYFVSWDGVTYEVITQDASSFMEGAVFIGNGEMLGLSGNGEPFAIGCTNGTLMYLAFTDASESHTIGIQKSTIKEIVLQDKTITENGEYTADEGFDGLGKVLVEIAGAGGSYKFAEGSVKPTSTTSCTVDHYCGVVPDIVIVFAASTISGGKFAYSFGFSKAMMAKTSGSIKSISPYITSSGAVSYQDTNGIDADTLNSYYVDYGGIRNATSTSFVFGGTKNQLNTSVSYKYIAIYGLT